MSQSSYAPNPKVFYNVLPMQLLHIGRVPDLIRDADGHPEAYISEYIAGDFTPLWMYKTSQYHS